MANIWQAVEKPEGKKYLDFHNAQAATRKDVERAFGILQAQFAIVRGSARFWDQKMLWYIMHACVIMHNMIIENERGQDVDYSQYELLEHPVRVRRRDERVEGIRRGPACRKKSHKKWADPKTAWIK